MHDVAFYSHYYHIVVFATLQTHTATLPMSLPVRRCGLVQADVPPGSNLLQEQPTEQRIMQGDSEAVDRGQVVGEYDRSGLNTNMEMVGLCCRHVSPFLCAFAP